jgi:hypothetical protein
MTHGHNGRTQPTFIPHRLVLVSAVGQASHGHLWLMSRASA